MNKQILILVNHNRDVGRVVELLRFIFPRKDIRRTYTARTIQVNMNNGLRIDIWSVEDWYDGITSGANFDKVCYLTQPPKFIVDALKHCLIHTEKEAKTS